MTRRTVRVLTADEVATLVDWAGREGWNPGHADPPAFQAADPNGFLGAFVGDTMVAGIAAVAYDPTYGFIGLYICHPDWRGQGHGKAVWDAGMNYLGNRTIGLDGVPEQQANYASMGFVRAYETVRMSGVVANAASSDVQDIGPDVLMQVQALDRQCFPADRPAFLAHWLAPPHRAVGLFRHGALVGYAVARQCILDHKFGPLFAQTLDDAEALLGAFSGMAVQLDVPAHQAGLMASLAAQGFAPGFTTARMYRGAPPAMDTAKVFAVTSLELG